MKLKVNQDVCIGCGACAAICPEVFDIDDTGLAVAIVNEIDEKMTEDALDAKEGCPTGAIVEDNEEVAEDDMDLAA